MSRTYKDKRERRRIVKNKKMQSMLGVYGEDFYQKNKTPKKGISKLIRARRKKEAEKEIKEYLG